MSDSHGLFVVPENAHGIVMYNADFNSFDALPKYVKDRGHAFHALLTDRLYCGYPVENVKRLVNPTMDQFRGAFDSLRDRCDEESTVLLFFSGRSARIRRGLSRGSYICLSDTVRLATTLSTHAFC